VSFSSLSSVEFPADDPERARRFWTGLLGVELEGRQLKAAGQVPAQAGHVGRGGTACQFFHTAGGKCFHYDTKQGGSKPSLASIAAHG
jgi:catechol 2,3-dioxygenase-like lactoylglutathione lyase family enzyme